MARLPDVSQVWRGNHPWAVVYDRIASDERAGPVLWRLGMGSDMGLLHRSAARELTAVRDGGAVLDIPCGGGVALRNVPPTSHRTCSSARAARPPAAASPSSCARP